MLIIWHFNFAHLDLDLYWQYVGLIFFWKIMKTKPCRSYHLQITPILVASFNFKTSGLLINPQYSFEILKSHIFWQYMGHTSTLIISKKTLNFTMKNQLSMYSIILNNILSTKYLRNVQIMHNLRLKIRSEPHIQIFKMAALLPPGHCTINHGWNLLHSHFQPFFGEIMTYFRECDVITMGIPPKQGNPSDFIPEHAFQYPTRN